MCFGVCDETVAALLTPVAAKSVDEFGWTHTSPVVQSKTSISERDDVVLLASRGFLTVRMHATFAVFFPASEFMGENMTFRVETKFFEDDDGSCDVGFCFATRLMRRRPVVQAKPTMCLI